jgi:hypothetical protein
MQKEAWEGSRRGEESILEGRQNIEAASEAWEDVDVYGE